MAHYTRTHKSAARLQMHTPGWNQREHTRPCNGFLYTLHPDRDIHWPENRVPASTKIFHHLGSMGIQAWLLTIALFAPLSPVHSARWCSIPAMDTHTTPSSLLPLHFPANLQPGQPPPPPYRRALAFVRWTEFEGIDGPPGPADTHEHPQEKKGWTTRESNRTEIGFYTGQLSFLVLRRYNAVLCRSCKRNFGKRKKRNHDLMHLPFLICDVRKIRYDKWMFVTKFWQKEKKNHDLMHLSFLICDECAIKWMFVNVLKFWKKEKRNHDLMHLPFLICDECAIKWMFVTKFWKKEKEITIWCTFYFLFVKNAR